MQEKEYDYLIVGAGLFGCVMAHELRKRGRKCLLVEKRKYAGGNIHCENMDGIQVHMHGAHIFHTNDEKIWNYVNAFVPFNRFTNSPLAVYRNKVYNLPFNMNTFYQLWGIMDPQQAKEKIAQQIAAARIGRPANLEEQALSLVGHDIYHTFIKEYSEKQWGRSARSLPAFLIKRIPLRFTWDNNYFNDRYQGIPIGGYNQLIDGLTKGIEIKTNTDYRQHRAELHEKADNIIYSGMIDAFFDFRLGALEYRSLHFEHQRLEMENFQGNAVINYTDATVPYTRIIEHKHFEFGTQPHTIITREYPQAFHKQAEPYYPVNDEKNNRLYREYMQLSAQHPHVLFGGRLGNYRYYDMHQVIAAALHTVQTITREAIPGCVDS